MADPAVEALALRDAGHTVDEIAERQGVSVSQVYRRIKQAQDGPGPTERAARAVVATWGDMDEMTRLTAEGLIGLAIIGDAGRSRDANGVDRSAGVSALKDLKAWIADLGQTSGFEELRDALLAA
jgi:transposase-like protein